MIAAPVSPETGPDERTGSFFLRHPALPRAVVSLVAGGLLYLSFPPRTTWWLAVVAFALFAGVIRGRRARAGFGYGFLFAVAFLMPSLYWLQNFLGEGFGPTPWIGLSVASAVLIAVPAAGMALVSTLRGGPVWMAAVYAGGNDLLRPSVDIDALMDDYDKAIGRLVESGATVVVFTGVDGVEDALFRKMRGRVAVYNEHARVIAARRGALVVDMWAMRQLRDRRMWAPDRLHLNTLGHIEVAVEVLGVLGAGHSLTNAALGPRATLSTSERRAQNLQWSKEHAWPWVRRRLRGESSGDHLTPKRPVLAPVNWPH